jgi:hypothetical protein
MHSLESDKLRLTDFMDLPTLQEIQDSFAAVANVKATITDADGKLLTQPTPTREFLRRQSALAADEEKLTAQGGPAPEGPQKEGAEYVAPIIVNNQRLGTIRMTANGALAGIDDAKLAALAVKAGIDIKQLKSLSQSLLRAKQSRPAAIQFLFLLANAPLLPGIPAPPAHQRADGRLQRHDDALRSARPQSRAAEDRGGRL